MLPATGIAANGTRAPPAPGGLERRRGRLLSDLPDPFATLQRLLGILELQVANLDWGYLTNWAATMGLTTLLARARTEARFQGPPLS